MELFKPSKKVLEIICDNENPVISYQIYPFGSHKEMQEICSLNEAGLYEQIINFYRKDGIALNEKSKERLNYEGIYGVIGEVFKNWVYHSPENLDLSVGLFFGSKGICYGVCDGGEFFKNPKIKKQLENKINFEEFNSNPREDDCCQEGFNAYIFPNSDFIEVDSKKGILYCVQLKENIIAPEGKNGSSYFYNLREQKK